MKLDKRIDDIRVKLMTCFNTDEARQYVGQKGYFTNNIGDYQDLEFTDFRTLDVIDNDEVPFKAEGLWYRFFLPAAFVSPVAEEKKWRPFTLDEFRAKFPLLSPVTFKKKEKEIPKTFCFVGYTANGAVILGSEWYSLNILFEDYELKDEDGNWVPFGVEE